MVAEFVPNPGLTVCLSNSHLISSYKPAHIQCETGTPESSRITTGGSSWQRVHRSPDYYNSQPNMAPSRLPSAASGGSLRKRQPIFRTPFENLFRKQKRLCSISPASITWTAPV